MIFSFEDHFPVFNLRSRYSTSARPIQELDKFSTFFQRKQRRIANLHFFYIHVHYFVRKNNIFFLLQIKIIYGKNWHALNPILECMRFQNQNQRNKKKKRRKSFRTEHVPMTFQRDNRNSHVAPTSLLKDWVSFG